MPKHRVLVRYRLPMSDELRLLPISNQWSDLQWCDIEQTESNELRIRVASAVQGARMPRDDAFEDLAPELAKKLLVIDCSEPEGAPESRDWPLRAGQADEFESYCLVSAANDMFRINFRKPSNLCLPQGHRWVAGRLFNPLSTISLQRCFTDTEIAHDKRLGMRSSADNYDLLVYPRELILDLKRQYRESAITPVLQHEEVPHKVQTAVVDPSHDQTNQYWLTTERREKVAIDRDSVLSALLDEDRILLHSTVCRELTGVKNNCNSPEEYQLALYTLLSKDEISTDFSEDLMAAIRLFRNTMLRSSMDLNRIFAQEGSTKPSLATVCQYVFECVFQELKNQDSSLVSQSSDDYITRSRPDAYLNIYLGSSNEPSEVWQGRHSSTSTANDARYAAFLQVEELQQAQLNSASSNSPLVVGARDVSEGLESEQGGRQSNSLRPNLAHLHPRLHSMSLFRSTRGQMPSEAPQVNRLLLRFIGAALCGLGFSLAFSSFFTGAAILAGGILCLLASNLPTNHNPAANYVAPSGGFGGYGARLL